MRVVIGGMAKSGTTALFYAVRSGMPPGTLCLFEPKRYRPVPTPHVLAKILANPGVDWSAFKRFHKKLHIARYPRDRLISAGLYGIYGYPRPISQDAEARLLDLIRRKEADSTSLSFRDICDQFGQILGGDRIAGYLTRLELGCRTFLQHRDFHCVRYEDFVAGNVQAIEAYLGFDLPGAVQVAPSVKRVERTKGSGDWRNWFTAADVDFFRPRLREAFGVLGYEDVWDLSPSPRVDPKHGSDYVARLIADQRRKFDRPKGWIRGWPSQVTRSLRLRIPSLKLRH
ncbi:MAG: hypothetical protein AB7P22_11705 [Vicinamibacterales bacterium]